MDFIEHSGLSEKLGTIHDVFSFWKNKLQKFDRTRPHFSHHLAVAVSPLAPRSALDFDITH